MFRIHILDVGRGDSIIMQFSNGRTYLIDSNVVSHKVTPYDYLTQELGVTELETVTSALLGADAQLDSWAYILSEHREKMQAGLLKVSHHGSDYGTYKDILAAINPHYAVITTGPNPYGHPEQCALSFVTQAASQGVFRTDVDGTCVFESDGTGWKYVSL